MSASDAEGPSPGAAASVPTWSIVSRDELGEPEVSAMLRIHRALYDGVDEARFRRDLAAKDEVVLLRRGDRICGYSTLAIEAHASGRWVLTSGDTGVDRDAWGSPALALGWLAAALRWRERCAALDWLLLAGGPRTWRFLPLFFTEHWPHPSRPTPAEVQSRLDALATARWGDRYANGIVRLGEPPLRAEHEPVRDHAADAFFRRANPGYLAGDELVCLARVDRDNLTAAGRRILRGVGG